MGSALDDYFAEVAEDILNRYKRELRLMPEHPTFGDPDWKPPEGKICWKSPPLYPGLHKEKIDG